METQYIFENNITPKIINISYSGNNNIFYMSHNLLEKIAVIWKCEELCKKIKNKMYTNLFNNRISCVKPILLNNAIIYDNGDIYSNDILYRTTYHKNDKCSYLLPINNKKNVICLTGKWSGEIFHFPFEFLCGLRLFENYNNKCIHVKKNKYTIEWLELCGITDIIDGNYYVNELYVPYFPPCGNPDLDDILWLKHIVEKNIVKKDIVKNIILVKRNKTRCIQNYFELEQYVITYAINNNLNLIIHDDDNLPSLKMQLQYFNEAKIIITPHGGSEVNLIACNKNAIVIELMDIDYTNICFARIAYFLNLNYYAIETNNYVVNMRDIHNILTGNVI
jgi:hypothetical protein